MENFAELSLCRIDADSHDELWELFGQDLSKLPFTWPRSAAEFESWLASSGNDIYPQRYSITININHSETTAGIISADLVDDDNHTTFQLAHKGDVNISYITLAQYAGKGIASFGLKCIVDVVLKGGYDPILRIASWNKASIRVAEKCGFHKAGSDIVIQYQFDYEPTLLGVYRLEDEIKSAAKSS